MTVRDIPTNLIVGSSENSFDIEHLAADLAEVGLINPILVQPEDHLYRLIAGNRRFAAWMYNAKENPQDEKWQTIPAHVYTGPLSAARLAYSENLLEREGSQQRKDEPTITRKKPQVTVSFEGDSWMLTIEGRPPVHLTDQFTSLMLRFALKIREKCPHSIVSWKEQAEARKRSLHQKVAPSGLRCVTARLNHTLETKLGAPPNGEKWLVTKRGKGSFLNSSVTWALSEKTKNFLVPDRSVYCHYQNPSVTEREHCNRDERLPARRRTKPPTGEDDLD